MSNEKLLAEWFWIDRWMGSSAFLLPIEPRGLYREMLTQAWRRGAKLPNDHQAIQRAIGCTRQEWNRCWPKVEPYWRVTGDSLINDTQVKVYAECQSSQEKFGSRARKAAQARWGSGPKHPASIEDSNAHALPEVCPPDPIPERQNKKEPSSKDPVPGDLFAVHDRLFRAKYAGEKPAPYTGADAGNAKKLLRHYGLEKATRLVEGFFATSDPFIARSGHGFGILASSTVQNKLIAELSQRQRPPALSSSGVPSAAETKRMLEDRERKAAS